MRPACGRLEDTGYQDTVNALVPNPTEKPTHLPVPGSYVPKIPEEKLLALQECGVWSGAGGPWIRDQQGPVWGGPLRTSLGEGPHGKCSTAFCTLGRRLCLPKSGLDVSVTVHLFQQNVVFHTGIREHRLEHVAHCLNVCPQSLSEKTTRHLMVCHPADSSRCQR